MASRIQYFQKIKNLEEQYNVNNWNVNGIDVWPIIRNMLMSYYIENSESFEQNNRSVKKQTKLTKLKNFVSQLWEILLFVCLKKLDVIGFFFTEDREINENVSYIKLLDPVFDELEKMKHTCFLIEANCFHKASNYYKPNRIIPFYYFNKLINLLSSKQEKKNIVENIKSVIPSSFIQEVEDAGVSFSEINQRLIHMVILVKFFRKLFKRKNIKKLYTICYYSDTNNAAVIAANLQGISTIDIQHGLVTNHRAYSDFSPQKFYNSLPGYFWSWDYTSACHINSWAKNTLHKSIEAFNPWLCYAGNFKTKIIKKDNTKPRILITLQPTGKILDDFVAETIKMTKEEYNWYIRLHPVQMQNKDRILGWFKEKGLFDIVNINEAGSLPLPVLLAQTDIHLTKFSSSFIEALQFGVPTIFTDVRGTDYFAAYIKNGEAFSLDEYEQNTLFLKIQEVLTSEKQKEQIQYKSYHEVFAQINVSLPKLKIQI